MNIIDAAHKTVHAYPGGSESLAPRIDMSAAVLRNKVNPNNDTHHLTWEEALEVMDVTDDDRMLYAMAAARGYTLQKQEDVADTDIVTLLLNIAADKGELSAEFAKAYADRVITPNERDRMNAIVFRLIAKFVKFAQQANAATGMRAAA